MATSDDYILRFENSDKNRTTYTLTGLKQENNSNNVIGLDALINTSGKTGKCGKSQ